MTNWLLTSTLSINVPEMTLINWPQIVCGETMTLYISLFFCCTSQFWELQAVAKWYSHVELVFIHLMPENFPVMPLSKELQNPVRKSFVNSYLFVWDQNFILADKKQKPIVSVCEWRIVSLSSFQNLHINSATRMFVCRLCRSQGGSSWKGIRCLVMIISWWLLPQDIPWLWWMSGVNACYLPWVSPPTDVTPPTDVIPPPKLSIPMLRTEKEMDSVSTHLVNVVTPSLVTLEIFWPNPE